MKDSLGTRMKQYERSLDIRTVPHIPTILRIDGKAFHTYTKEFQRPYDRVLQHAMQHSAHKCYSTLHFDFAYGQSDEVSFVFYRPKTTSQEDFDGRLFKLSSIMASAFTYHFQKYMNHINKIALFDCRVFQLPKNEVVNYFIWRQQDSVRNSIQMLGQSNFSHKQLHGKSCNKIQDMLFTEKNINWNDIDTEFKRGWCVDKIFIDRNIPTFTEDRNYIINKLEVKENDE